MDSRRKLDEPTLDVGLRLQILQHSSLSIQQIQHLKKGSKSTQKTPLDNVSSLDTLNTLKKHEIWLQRHSTTKQWNKGKPAQEISSLDSKQMQQHSTEFRTERRKKEFQYPSTSTTSINRTTNENDSCKDYRLQVLATSKGSIQERLFNLNDSISTAPWQRSQIKHLKHWKEDRRLCWEATVQRLFNPRNRTPRCSLSLLSRSSVFRHRAPFCCGIKSLLEIDFTRDGFLKGFKYLVPF